MFAHIAAIIQDTIIIVWIASNVPTKYRGKIMALNIIAFTVVKQFVQIFESDQEYFAVTADTDVNG
jgi:hypothetical protein